MGKGSDAPTHQGHVVAPPLRGVGELSSVVAVLLSLFGWLEGESFGDLWGDFFVAVSFLLPSAFRHLERLSKASKLLATVNPIS